MSGTQLECIKGSSPHVPSLAKKQEMLRVVTSAWKTLLGQLLVTWFVPFSESYGIDIINGLVS